MATGVLFVAGITACIIAYMNNGLLGFNLIKSYENHIQSSFEQGAVHVFTYTQRLYTLYSKVRLTLSVKYPIAHSVCGDPERQLPSTRFFLLLTQGVILQVDTIHTMIILHSQRPAKCMICAKVLAVGSGKSD